MTRKVYPPINIGDKFHYLTVLAPAEDYIYTDKTGRTSSRRRWHCKCICGRCSISTDAGLKKGTTKSCGCYSAEQAGNRLRKHSMSNTTIYGVWQGIKSRCYNPKSSCYKDYGGRGIKMCDRWYTSFEDFYKDMGDSPAGLSLDRVDNAGDYTPENCRWATGTEQATNRRKRKGCASKYMGVSFHTRDKYWYAFVCLDGGSVEHLGKYASEVAAAKAYNCYCIKYSLARKLNDVGET